MRTAPSTIQRLIDGTNNFLDAENGPNPEPPPGDPGMDEIPQELPDNGDVTPEEDPNVVDPAA